MFGLAVAAIAVVGVADAAVTKLASVGSWELYGGTADDGKPVCSMSSSGNGLYFGVKYYKGDSGLTIQVSHSDWKLKDGLKIKTTMQFDKGSPWSANASSFHWSSGEAALELLIPNSSIDAWIEEFAAADSMLLSFPDEKAVDDWQLDLAGSSTIAQRMETCAHKL